MNLPLVSVIIPVYNVEKYLDRCVESVINQTYSNLEIILIDDGSPDNCPKMCDVWAEKDARVQVIHKKNGGLSDARNFGLDVCKGAYIYFIDSDDTICENTIEVLLDLLLKNHSSLSYSMNIKVYEDETIEETDNNSFDNSVITYDSDAFWMNFYQFQVNADWDMVGNMVMSCNKLYDAKLFKHLRFELGKIHEDEFIIHQIICQCGLITFLNTPLYQYYQRSKSIMNTEDTDSTIHFYEALTKRTLFFVDNYKAYSLSSFYHLCYYLIPFYVRNKDVVLRRKVKLLYNDTYKSVRELLKQTPKSISIPYKLFFASPLVYRIYKKLKKYYD